MNGSEVEEAGVRCSRMIVGKGGTNGWTKVRGGKVADIVVNVESGDVNAIFTRALSHRAHNL